MRKLTYTSIITVLLIGAFITPARALSEEAQLFMDTCRAIDCPVVPFDDDRETLRYAVLEVLDEVEAGYVDRWYLKFCLKTLGYAGFPEDAHRILAYKDDMPKVVLLSLRGFPHPDAIEYLLQNVDNKEVTMRKVAVESLAEIDFKKLDEPSKWHGRVLNKLRQISRKERVTWVSNVIDDAIDKVETSGEHIN